MITNPYESKSNLPFIIAEIGINHNGQVSVAKSLIDMARDCGCDAVKFQKRDIDVVYTREFLDSPRQSPWGDTQRAQKQGLEFDKDQYDEIDAYCRQLGIHWFASAWDERSQEFLRQYDLPCNKVASAMITHSRLVEMIAEEGKYTFISTGMTNLRQVDEVVDIFEKKSCPYTVMHCVSIYPCPDEWCNVSMVKVLRDRYRCPVGYSGHEHGILPSVLAVALGADAVERHITLDRTMYGSDQSASLERRGLELLVRDAKNVRNILGNGTGDKVIIPEEEQVAYKLRYFREESLA